MTGEMLKNEIAHHLEEVILPFWMKLRDDEHGGFYGLVDRELVLHREAVKGCILNNRILWFFSNAYLTLRRPELLEYAAHAYAFLKEACLDRTYGGVYWSVTYDGKPEEDMKHTYNQAFAVYALSSYYDASGDKEALELAWEIYHVIETRCRAANGYEEAFDRQFCPADNEKLSENGVMAERTMNTLLHVFEAYTELYRVTGDGQVAERLKDILAIFAEKIYNPERRRQEVFFDADWNSLIDLHSYGHDIETSWLIDRGLELLKDDALTKRIAPMTDILTEQIYQRAFTGSCVLNECEKGTDNTARVWWIQAESVVGFLNYYRKHPEKEEYFQAAVRVWEYICDVIVDKRPGSEWFWDADEQGNPGPRAIAEPWKCPYHNGRMCFEVMKRL